VASSAISRRPHKQIRGPEYGAKLPFVQDTEVDIRIHASFIIYQVLGGSFGCIAPGLL